MTPNRQKVLALLQESGRPLSAYEVLDQLRAQGTCWQPPTVYRALDFLLENGLVHRIASLNAFIGCVHPGELHQGQFLICKACHAAIELELPAISQAIVAGAAAVGFAVESQTVEVVGLCAGCQEPT